MRRRIFLLSLYYPSAAYARGESEPLHCPHDSGAAVADPAMLASDVGVQRSRALDGGLNQLFLLTTPSIVDPTVFLTTLRLRLESSPLSLTNCFRWLAGSPK